MMEDLFLIKIFFVSWVKEKYEKTMKQKNIAIGNNMTNAKMEYFREIKTVNEVKCPTLQQTHFTHSEEKEEAHN